MRPPARRHRGRGRAGGKTAASGSVDLLIEIEGVDHPGLRRSGPVSALPGESAGLTSLRRVPTSASPAIKQRNRPRLTASTDHS